MIKWVRKIPRDRKNAKIEYQIEIEVEYLEFKIHQFYKKLGKIQIRRMRDYFIE